MVKTNEQFKEMTINEFDKTDETQVSDNIGLFNMYKDDYPSIFQKKLKKLYLKYYQILMISLIKRKIFK